jgi:hypothetical protein
MVAAEQVRDVTCPHGQVALAAGASKGCAQEAPEDVAQYQALHQALLYLCQLDSSDAKQALLETLRLKVCCRYPERKQVFLRQQWREGPQDVPRVVHDELRSRQHHELKAAWTCESSSCCCRCICARNVQCRPACQPRPEPCFWQGETPA